MRAARQEAAFSVEEARRLEESRPELRMELIEGVIYSMGRATPWHAAMTAALAGILRDGLGPGSPCRAYAESLAVGTSASDPTYVHPDVTVICGPAVTHPDEPTVVLNASAIFEVLSPGTELRDRNEKLAKYQAVPSVRAIVYFDHERVRASAWLRLEDGWHQLERGPGQTLALPSLGVELHVGALYAEVRDAPGGPA